MKSIPCFSLTAVLATAFPASAITAVWSGTSGRWDDAAKWTGGVAPVNTSDVGRIANDGAALYDSAMSYSFGGLELGPGSGSGSFEMTGGSLTTSTDIRIGGNAAGTGGSGTMTLSGGDIRMTGGNFNIGFGSTASGTLNMSGGSILVQTSTIFAVGNRGTGTVNQTGGTVQVLGTSSPGVSTLQLGRNVTTGTGFGSYDLTGGSVTAAQLFFGNAVSTPLGSVNHFSLSGTGVATLGVITALNTNALNVFNFTGGRLFLKASNINLTNFGGILEPTDLNFGAATAGNVPADATGILEFGPDVSYFQMDEGTLAIDIDGPGSNDALSIGGNSLGRATIGGTIAVRLLNNYDPPLGATFDIVLADTVTNTALVTGLTPSGLSFRASKRIEDGTGQEMLFLTVSPGPAPLAITQVGPITGGGNQLPITWTSDAFSIYHLETSMDMIQWQSSNNIQGQGDTTTFTDNLFPAQTRLFYRVVRISP